MSVLNTPIEYLKGVGSHRAELIKKELNIFTINDILNFFPFRYLDKTQYYKIAQLSANLQTEVQIIGRIINIKTVANKKSERLVATFTDGDNTMELVWFKGIKWIREKLTLNQYYVAFGKINHFNGGFSMPHPELELLEEHKKNKTTGLQPLYHSTERLSQRQITNKTIANMVQHAIMMAQHELVDVLPQSLKAGLSLMPRQQAIVTVHFPNNSDELSKARFRLKFEELFFIQLQLLSKNIDRKQKIKGFSFPKIGDYFNNFYQNHLPFPLTNAQKRVIKEIRQGMLYEVQMNRLLQGDVGAGKTIVAFLCMLMALDNGFQACIMAPTEILSSQHFVGMSQLAEKIGVKLALLTGSTKTAERKRILQELESGEIQIIVGTHALLEEKVRFSNLGLAIIDEQHRFGVEQRAKLWYKNHLPPHILVMTATPIPRTLAMSLYGDLDVSVIDELPPGRKPIETYHLYEANRLKMIKFMRDEIAKGRQVYVVYPLIQESEKLDYMNLLQGYEAIQREFPMPEYQISVVHGKMPPQEKDYEMERFIKGQTHIMVATTVIEVGVNVPNASVMIIESAERFGLSQLHQLRGRVGRGAEQSYCILMTGNKLSADTKVRMETMCRTNDGFEIADVDLKLRGPGDIMGTQQSGILNLKIADLVKDQDILKLARQKAVEILKQDISLSLPENEGLRLMLNYLAKKNNLYSYIS